MGNQDGKCRILTPLLMATIRGSFQVFIFPREYISNNIRGQADIIIVAQIYVTTTAPEAQDMQYRSCNLGRLLIIQRTI